MEERNIKLAWTGLFGLRFLLTIMPQYGFISDEEFSKSAQLAADVFGFAKHTNEIDIYEFGLFYPMFTSGIPFLILGIINESGVFGKIVTPYSVLIAPRIWMTLCSISIDVHIYKIAVNCGCSTRTALSAMLLFAGSYIPHVYFTRTLPVSIMAVLYSALLYNTTKNMSLSKNQQEKGLLATIFEASFIAVLTSMGTGLDTRFFRYAILPVLFWIVFSTTSYFFRLVRASTFCYIFVITLPIVFQQLITIQELPGKQFYHIFSAIDDIIMTLRSPSTIKYFLQFMGGEIESIGSIPEKIIFLINLLCNIFGPVLLVLCNVIFRRNFFSELISNSHDALLVSVVLQPVLEAIILKQVSENAMLLMIIPITVLVIKHGKIGKLLFALYMLFNFGNLILDGVYIDGGALHSMEFLGSVINKVNHAKEIEIVFFETPVPPYYLTARECVIDQSGACVGQNGARFRFTETTIDTLLPTLDNLLLQDDEPLVFLVIHSSLPCKFLHKLHILYKLHTFYKYFPHINPTAASPDLFNTKEWCNSKGEEVRTLTDFIQEKYALNIYGVSRPGTRLIRRPEIYEHQKLTLVLDRYSSSI